MFNLGKPITVQADSEKGEPIEKWIDITVEDNDRQVHRYRASFLTDVPGDLLDGAIEMLRDRYTFILEIDTKEEGFYSFINSPLHMSMCVTNGDQVFKAAYEDPLELAEYILSYVNENKEEIFEWLSYMGEEHQAADYKENMRLKAEELHELIVRERAKQS